MRISLKLLAPAIATVAFGCKPPQTDTSSTQSLDNFARGDGAAVTRNQCSGSFSDFAINDLVLTEKSLSDSQRKIQIARVEKALSAVPSGIKKVFASHGNIFLTSDLSKHCKLSEVEKEFASEGGELEACWKLDGGVGLVVINPSKDNIEHHTVRLFAYVTGKLYPMIASATESELTDDGRKELQNLASLKAALQSSFDTEFQASGVKSARVVRMRSLGNEAYREFLFAEAFDSHYCSDRTRAAFEKFFPKTANLWKRAVVDGEPLKATADSGFSSSDKISEQDAVLALNMMNKNKVGALFEGETEEGGLGLTGSYHGNRGWYNPARWYNYMTGTGGYANTGHNGGAVISNTIGYAGPAVASDVAGAIQPVAGAMIVGKGIQNRNRLIQNMSQNPTGNWNAGPYGNGQTPKSQQALQAVGNW